MIDSSDFDTVRAQTYSTPERETILGLIAAHGHAYDSVSDLIADYITYGA